MAKLKNINLLTTKQLIGGVIDINSLTVEELRVVVGKVAKTSNRRIYELAKTPIGRISPAYSSRMKNYGGTFSLTEIGRQTDVNALRQTFKEAKGFLNLKTSSVSGWKKFRSDIIKNIQEQVSGDVKIDIDKLLSSRRKSIKFWKAYRKLEEANGSEFGNHKQHPSRNDSLRIQEMIARRLDKQFGFGGFKQTADDVVDALIDKVTTAYQETKKAQRNLNKSPSDIVNDGEDDGTYNE